MTDKSKKILIIEDEMPMARALELKLMHRGFEVKTTFNGEEGKEMIQKEIYNLIIIDLVMPKMNGFEILEMLKKKKIKTPVIVLTNLSQEDDVKRAKIFGVKEYFIKSNTPIVVIVEYVVDFLK